MADKHLRLYDEDGAALDLVLHDNGDGTYSLGAHATQLPAALAAGGGLPVEGVAGGVSVPVSGTVTAQRTSLAASPSDVSVPAENTAAVVTRNAVPDYCHVIKLVRWSFRGTPTNATLKVEDGAGNVVEGPHPIPSEGPGFWPFADGGKRGTANTAMIVTVSAGGAGTYASLSCDIGLEAAP